MPRLIIQLNSTVPQDDFHWLADRIPPLLGPFNLAPLIYIQNATAPPAPSFVWTDDTLYQYMSPIIQNSPHKADADANGDWFLDLFITSRHQAQYLGVMYDLGSGTSARQGCAVFWEEVKRHSSDDNAFQRIMLRTTMHEIGHCLNMVHEFDGTIMTQTIDMENMFGGGWINRINYQYAQKDIDWVIDNPSAAAPGGTNLNFGLGEDIGRSSGSLGVRLRIFKDKNERSIISGSPLPLLIELHNKSSIPIELSLPLTMNSGGIKVWITSPDGSEHLVKCHVKGCDSVSRGLQIPTGKKHFPLYLFSGVEGYLFDKPGTYKVRVAVRGQARYWFNSRKITFVVNPPDNNAAHQKQILSQPEMIGYMSLGPNFPGGEEIAERAIAAEPSSEASRAIYWNQVHAIKTLGKRKKVHVSKRTASRLLSLYSVLLTVESSSVRKGKIWLEIEMLSQNLGKSIVKGARERRWINSYTKFKTDLIEK